LPSGTASPNEATLSVVKVPDERLEKLATLVGAKKTTYLEQRIHDFPGFSVGKKGPPAQLLGQLQTADLLVHVVHAFDDASTPHPLESIDPARDIEALDLELALADLGVIERRLERLKAESRSLAAANRGPQEREMALLTRLKEGLENEKPVREAGLTPEEKTLLGGFNLLTGRPMLIVLNINEGDAARSAEIEARAKADFAAPERGVVAIAVKSEADVAELDPEEAAEFRKDLELPETPAAERMLQEAVSLLGLITFYTAGPQDTHAWSIPAGTNAQKAAGRIHSDIERGFIRAEVMGWQDLLEAGSHAEAKKKGLLRLEGKTYEMQDGDVINVLFNV
jgi:GTP-binding protein YchF